MENCIKMDNQQLDGLSALNKKFCLEFKNLCYTVVQKKGRKSSEIPIIKNVSGKFESGHLTAILGPSGTGKTSLLNVLSGFKTTGMSGSVFINGEERNVAGYKKMSCYITQDFAMLGLLTTRETLMIAADLKLGSAVKKSRKIAIVDEILKLLGLEKAKNTFVEKLSGGEKKRLSIGVELVTNPPIMFFDEPTSGLDSSSSIQVISHLKSLAEAGRIVVCSIHQPSSQLFEMFEDVYLLAEGQCIYRGSLSDMTNVLEEEGFLCPKYYNRADFAIEVACVKRGTDLQKLINRFNKEFNKSEDTITTEDDKEITYMLQPADGMKSETVVQISSNNNYNGFVKYPLSSWSQFIVLTKRSMMCTFRDIYVTQARVAIHIIVGVVLGLLCYNIGNDASKVPSNVACIFFFLLVLFLLAPVLTVLVFPLEADVFYREQKNNWYSLRAYFFSKLAGDLFLQIFCPTVFLLSSYYLTNQPYSDMRFLKFWLLGLLVTFCGQAMGFTFGAGFSAQMAVCTLISYCVFLALFSGFLVRLMDIPNYLYWLSYLSYLRFAYEGGMIVIYGGNRTKLDCEDMYCHYKSPAKLLEDLGMLEVTYEQNMLLLFIGAVIMYTLFYLVLKYRIYLSK